MLDFGIAKETSGQLVGEVTRTGEVLGSPHYMSPEQVRGEKDIDYRSDLWSLGVITFRAITGKLPFAGDQLGLILAKILVDSIPRATRVAPDLPSAIDGFFARALARERTQRFQSVGEMLDALRLVADPLPRSASTSGAYTTTPPRFDSDPGRSGPGQAMLLPSDPAVPDETRRVGRSANEIPRQEQQGDDGAAGLQGAHAVLDLSVTRPMDIAAAPQAADPSVAASLSERSEKSVYVPPMSAVQWLVPLAAATVAVSVTVWFAGRTTHASLSASGLTGAPAQQGPTTAALISGDHSPIAVVASAQQAALPGSVMERVRDEDAPSHRAPRPPQPAASSGKIDRRSQSMPEGQDESNAPSPSPDPPRETTEVPPAPEEPAAPPQQPYHHRFARRVLNETAAKARNCATPTGPTGSGTVRVIFAPSGRVTQTIAGPPFAGTEVGSCIASTFRSIKIPAFAGTPVTESQSVTLP